MQQSSRLQVHGRITGIEPEPGGAATTRIEIDSRHDIEGRVEKLSRPILIHFFYPNYWPAFVSVLDRVWLFLELYADIKNISLTTRRNEIQPVSGKDKYEYRLTGGLFLWPRLSPTASVYFDCGVPMLLSVGRNMFEQAKSGSSVEISRGRIYGEVERPNVSSNT